MELRDALLTSNPGGVMLRDTLTNDEVALLISVDPGLSTGVAIFADGRLVRNFTTEPPHDLLRVLLEELDPDDEVVAEQGPTNHRRQANACEPVERLVHNSQASVRWVRPTAWKPSPAAILLPTDQPRTKHERDAIRMGRWRLGVHA